MHGADINASIHAANESVNNMDSDEEQRTRKAVESLLNVTVDTWEYFFLILNE